MQIVSWWIERRSKDGRRSLWAIDIEPVTLLMLIGLATTIIYRAILQQPKYIYVGPLALMWVGAAVILIAKLPLYRKGIWNSWGTSRMSARSARLYLGGYVLAVLGVLVLVLLKVLHNKAL